MRLARGVAALPLVVLLGLFAGCGGATGRVVYPAEIPVRSYPQVFLVHDSEPTIIEFATRLQRHLLRPNHYARTPQVTLMHRSQAEQMLAERSFPVTSVLVDLTFQGHNQDEVHIVQSGTTLATATINDVQLTLTLSVRDSSTGRILQVFVHSETERGRRRERNLEVVLRRFAQVVFPKFDPRGQRVRLHVPPVDHPAVEPALELLVDEQWSAARVALEAALQDPSVQALPPEILARVHYNLAIARRFDPATMDDLTTHYAAAQEAAAAAVALDPTNGRYVQMQQDLQADAQRAAIVRQHEGAAAVNYGEATAPPESAPPAETTPAPAETAGGESPVEETPPTGTEAPAAPASDEPVRMPVGF